MSAAEIFLLDDLAPVELREAIWVECNSAHWQFGHGSHGDGAVVPFWYMELSDSPPMTELWKHAREQCQELAGRELKVARQYANGHTFGQGGQAHRDDSREGCYTLLYYPMPEWQRHWEGETVYLDDDGQVIGVVDPAPNRGVLFDARIPHHGRAPSRFYAGLRVTVAFKLEPV